MQKLRKQKRIKISYAKDALGKFQTIAGATSGRRGYYCLDCDKELEAVKPLGLKPRPYFRHYASDVRADGKPCTYSDETYRHKIAKEVLVRTRSIRVPRVPKYPPKGIDGPVKEVQPARTILAHSVLVERDFFEDENQNLHWGRVNGQDRTGIVRPDVIFFNATGFPILFIELVATHRPDFEKLAKIKRLGIDTVTVKVPTDSPEAIEDCFLRAYNTKWFFNNDQERTDYLRLPGPSGERISDFDEVQRGLFEESLLCRKNRIRNLIRAFDACLLAEQYKRIESEIRNEIERVDDERRRRAEFEGQIDSEISCSLDERRTALRQRAAKLERIRKYLKRKEEGLEDDAYNEFVESRGSIDRKDVRLNRLRERIAERYERKRRDIEGEESQFAEFIEQQRQHQKESSDQLESRKTELDTKLNELTGLFRKLKERSEMHAINWSPYQSRLNEEELKLNKSMQEKKSNYRQNLMTLRVEKQELSSSLEQKKRTLKTELDQLERSLSTDSFNLRKALLTQLREEILAEVPHCPERLRAWYQQANYLAVMNQCSRLSSEIDRLSDSLTQKLSKLGLKTEEFLNFFEEHTTKTS